MDLNYETAQHNLQTQLKRRRIIPRSNAGPGIWLSLVFPIVVIAGSWAVPSAPAVYKCAAANSLGLLVTAILIIKSYIERVPQQTPLTVYCVPGAVITNVTLFSICNVNFLMSLFGGVCSSYGYAYGLIKLLNACPRCFTFGEASIIVQAIALFVYTSLMNICEKLYYGINSNLCLETSTLILQVGWLGIATICSLVYYFPKLRVMYIFYSISFFVLVGIVIPLLYYMIQADPIMWILELLASDDVTLLLVMYWIICSLVAILAVNHQINIQQKASTISRKYFHILAIAVFIPAFLLERICLLHLSTGVIMALFVVLDMLRLLRMPPIGTSLQKAFNIYADDKDQGGLSLTPMYLLAGCSLPLWLHPEPSLTHLLPLLSGILTIGIGDTAASICGTLFGEHLWDEGTKTIEGTVGCILSQVALMTILWGAGFVESTAVVWLFSICGIIVISLVEAKTDQIDNLALPLLMYLFLL